MCVVLLGLLLFLYELCCHSQKCFLIIVVFSLIDCPTPLLCMFVQSDVACIL
jgi:hypothetical protein